MTESEVTQDAVLQLPAILVDAKDAARMLSIGTRLLWTKTKAGEIPVVKINRRVLYDPNDLRTWAENQKEFAVRKS